MKIRLRKLTLRTRQSTEQIPFSDSVTFLYGPVSTGKSTVARLVDYCFGGELERTPAIQREFVSVELSVTLGVNECVFERATHDTQAVRVTWTSPGLEPESVSAPLVAQGQKLVDEE